MAVAELDIRRLGPTTAHILVTASNWLLGIMAAMSGRLLSVRSSISNSGAL